MSVYIFIELSGFDRVFLQSAKSSRMYIITLRAS